MLTRLKNLLNKRKRVHFFATFITVNWGRGYDPGVFKQNVLRVLKWAEGKEHVFLLIQELDEEPDPAHERKEFMKLMEPGTHIVGAGRECIAVSPGVDEVLRERVKETMPAGEKLGWKGLGPTRYIVSCIAIIKGVRIGVWTTHPHRKRNSPKVNEAEREGNKVVANEIDDLTPLCDFVVGGGDMNTAKNHDYHPGQQTLNKKRLDWLWGWFYRPKKVKVRVVRRFSLNGTIDPHDPLGVTLEVTVK